MISLEPHEDGCVLSVRAFPERRNEIRGQQDGALKVCVTQIAEKGKANAAIRDQLAKSLGVRKSQIELIAGHLSPQKRFLIRAVDPNDLRTRLSALLAVLMAQPRGRRAAAINSFNVQRQSSPSEANWGNASGAE